VFLVPDSGGEERGTLVYSGLDAAPPLKASTLATGVSRIRRAARCLACAVTLRGSRDKPHPLPAVHTLNRSPHLHQDIAGIGVRRAETVAVRDSVPIARAGNIADDEFREVGVLFVSAA
jgi:hypothetical protein